MSQFLRPVLDQAVGGTVHVASEAAATVDAVHHALTDAAGLLVVVEREDLRCFLDGSWDAGHLTRLRAALAAPR